MAEPKSLGEMRADKSNDGRQWSVVECLRATIRAIEAGEIKPTQVAVLMLEFGEDGKRYAHHWRSAGMGFREHLALLEIHRKDIWDVHDGEG